MEIDVFFGYVYLLFGPPRTWNEQSVSVASVDWIKSLAYFSGPFLENV
jgi:hypothetical protein